MKHNIKKETWEVWCLRILKGAIIGVGAILPGLSGGVLAVVMGIYIPAMEFISNPFKNFKKQFMFLLPAGIGFVLGVIAFAKLVAKLFEVSPVPATWLFIGLILGTVPALFREAGAKGRGAGAWVSLFVAFEAILLIMFFTLDKVGGDALSLNTFWSFICGVFWGGGMIVPGLSSSNFIMHLGLYQPMLDQVGAINFAVIIPLVLGFVAVVVACSKLVTFFIRHFYACTFHAILGIVLASTICIIPMSPELKKTVLLYVMCFAGGLAIALGMETMSRKLETEK